MDLPQHRFGPTTFAKVNNSAELSQVLTDPCLNSDTIIVKTNWVSTEPGDFTDAETLRMLFETLSGRIVVTESYCFLRSMNILKNGKNSRLEINKLIGSGSG
jgi:hypothetical protein